MTGSASKWVATWVRDIPDVQWQWNKATQRNKHRQNTSSIKKECNVHVGGFWLVEFYSARRVLGSGVGGFSVQITQKYAHPAVVLEWGEVPFICFKYRKHQLFGSHEERDTSLFNIRLLLLLTAKLNKADQTHTKESSISFFPFPLQTADNLIVQFWLQLSFSTKRIFCE